MTAIFAVSSLAARQMFLADVYFEFASLSSQESPVFVSNHVCTLDTWILARALESYYGTGISVVAHEGVSRLLPFARHSLLPIASDPYSVRPSLRKIADEVDRSGRALLLFAEGTHYASCDALGDFRPGVRHLFSLLSPKKLIVPVGLCYYVFRKPRPNLVASSGRCSRTIEYWLDQKDTVEALRDAVNCQVAESQALARSVYRDRVRYPLQDWWTRKAKEKR